MSSKQDWNPQTHGGMVTVINENTLDYDVFIVGILNGKPTLCMKTSAQRKHFTMHVFSTIRH